jgi:hypothetical protein
MVSKTMPKGMPPKVMPANPMPMAVLPHQMVAAIKASPKGKIPAGLAKYIAAKKAAKGKNAVS